MQHQTGRLLQLQRRVESSIEARQNSRWVGDQKSATLLRGSARKSALNNGRQRVSENRHCDLRL